MAATAVNAPMMPPEVLKELQPYVALAAGLGRTAVQLVAETGFTDVSITYDSPRGDDLDTRLLRAMVIKVRKQPCGSLSLDLSDAVHLAALVILESSHALCGSITRSA